MPLSGRDRVRVSAVHTYTYNVCTMHTPQHCQALTCHYLDVLNKELCECSLHPLALPAENLRLLVLECLVGSRAAVQLAHMRYVFPLY